MKLFFSLCLPREGVTVPVVRHVCGASLRRLGVADDCVSDIEVALSEACSNVLKHAEASDDDYEVTIEVDPRRVLITVSDTGGRFEVDGADGVPPDLGAESGRGLVLMRKLVDNLHFVTEGRDRTTLWLEKSLDLSPDAVLRGLSEGDSARVT
jgi:serine/threonine-protein kinase RsbW